MPTGIHWSSWVPTAAQQKDGFVEDNAPEYYGHWTDAKTAKMLATGQLTGRQAHLLSTIATLQSADRGCYACNRTLAARIGVHPLTVPRMLTQLEELGLVWRQTVGGFRQIHIGQPPAPAPEQRGGDSAGAIGGIAPALSFEKESEKGNTLSQRLGTEGGVSSGTFFPVAPKKTTPIKEDTDAASTLADAVRKHLGMGRKVNVKAWATHFRLLRTVDGIPTDRLSTVLNWYVGNIGAQYTPQAFSGESFREKFYKIEQAAGRSLTLAVPETAPPHDDDTLDAVDRLAVLGWAGCEADLPEAFRITRGRYSMLLAALQARIKEEDSGEADSSVASVIYDTLPSPNDYAEAWMRGVHNEVMWKGADGLRRFLWTVDGAAFRKEVVGSLGRHGAPLDGWAVLLPELSVKDFE